VAKKTTKKPASRKRAKASAKKTSKPRSPKGAGKARAVKKKKTTTVRKKSPLTKAELNQFRQMLLEKRRDLIGDMDGIQAEALKSRPGGSGDLSNMPTHLADIGTDNFEQEFTLGLLESERVLLQEINEAMERIDNKTYGVCLGTGKPIGKARLRARPWAKYCIEYARMLEKGLIRPREETDEDEE
jgi:RNA polymerase-binding protein DksA